MRLAFLAVLVALSNAQRHPGVIPTPTQHRSTVTPPPRQDAPVIFRPGLEYTYHYKGHVLSGIPTVSRQFAGIVIDSLCKLQFQQDNYVVMKMEKISVYKINNKISTKPLEPLREGDLTLLTGEQAVIIIEYLNKPVKFRYLEGEVREVEKETTDRYWSLNIKKGILSLFQVALKEKSSSREPVRHQSSFYPSSHSVPFWRQHHHSNSSYKAVETDVTGTCETKYSVISDKFTISPGSVSTMHVTAVRDFDSCVTEPFHISGLFHGVEKDRGHKSLLHPMVHTDYIITGDRTHFLIKEVTLRGKYSFMPHGLDGGHLSTFIFQTLTLKTTEPIRTPIRLSTPKPCPMGLIMVIPDSLPEQPTSRRWTPLEEEHSAHHASSSEENREGGHRESVGEESDQIGAVIDNKLIQLLDCLYPSSDDSCAGILFQLGRVLRRVPADKLRSVLMGYLGEGSSSSLHSRTRRKSPQPNNPKTNARFRKSEVLLDLLPTLTSTDSALVVIKLIREQHISPIRGSLMIKALSLTVKPTPTVVKSLLDLFKEIPKEPTSRLGSKTLLRQSLLLGVGTVTHRMINVMRSHGKPQPEVLSFLENISGIMKRMLEEATGEEEKVLILKSVGNMGVIQLVPVLKSQVEASHLPLVVRIQAVMALRRVTNHGAAVKQVIPTLMSIYMDTKEERELREAAFLVIMSSNPGFLTLEMMVHKLRHEPCSQIRSLVYTTLVSLATHTIHQQELKELKRHVGLLLKNIRPVSVGFYDSMSATLGHFNEKYGLGGSLRLLKIKSKNSGLPEFLSAGLDAVFLGRHRQLLETGVGGNVLETLLRKLLGTRGLLKNFLKGEGNLRDFLSPLRGAHSGDTGSKISEILRKMKIEPNEDSKLYGSWNMKVLGNEIQHIVLNSENIQHLINQGGALLQELLTMQSRWLQVDFIKSLSLINTLTVATPIGIPLLLNHSVSGIFSLNGGVQFKDMPPISHLVKGLPLDDLCFAAGLHPRIDMSSYVGLGVNMGWLNSLVVSENTLRSTVPANVSVYLHTSTYSVAYKYYIPEKSFVPLHVKTVPLTIVQYFPTNATKLPYIMEAKEMESEQTVRSKSYLTKDHSHVSGMDFEYRLHSSSCDAAWCPKNPALYGKHEFSITALPTATVEHIHMRVMSLPTNFEGVPASVDTDKLFVTENRDLNSGEMQCQPHILTCTSCIFIDRSEKVNADPVFRPTEPLKRQIFIQVGPNTNHSPKVGIWLTWLTDPETWRNQVNVQIVRQAFAGNPPVEIILDTVVNPPSWKHMTSSSRNDENKEFLLKTVLKSELLNEPRNVKLEIRPGSDLDFFTESPELTLPETRAQKYKLTMEAEFTPTIRGALKYIVVTHDTLRYFRFSHVTTEIPTNPPSNKVSVAVEIRPWWQQMDVIVQTPLRNSYMTDLPFYWNPLFPTKEKPSTSWHSDNTTEEEMMFGLTQRHRFHDGMLSFNAPSYGSAPLVSGKCILKMTHLTTFDGVKRPMKKYTTPGCETVLTQDCSNRNLFSITASSDTTHWAMRYIVPGYDMKVMFNRNGFTGLVVNGRETKLGTSEPLIISERETDGGSTDLIKITRTNTSLVLKFHELGLEHQINIRDYIGIIKLSPVSPLQGQLCGLCGNYNLDQSDEFKIPEYMKVPSTRSWYYTSLIPSETCDIDRLISAPSNDSYMTEDHVRYRTYDDGEECICTSERKIKRCVPGCREVRVESSDARLRCEKLVAVGGERLEEGKASLGARNQAAKSGGHCGDFKQRFEEVIECSGVNI